MTDGEFFDAVMGMFHPERRYVACAGVSVLDRLPPWMRGRVARGWCFSCDSDIVWDTGVKVGPGVIRLCDPCAQRRILAGPTVVYVPPPPTPEG